MGSHIGVVGRDVKIAWWIKVLSGYNEKIEAEDWSGLTVEW